MTSIDAAFLSNPNSCAAFDLPSAAMRAALPLAAPRLVFGTNRKSIAAAGEVRPENHPDTADAIGPYGYLAMGCADDMFGSDSLDGEAAIVAEENGDGDPSGFVPFVNVNDNTSDARVLRERGDDPAVVIRLALRHARFGSGDVPFAIVCALHRHASAGDGAAQATLDMLKRRIERRQQNRRDRYLAIGLRTRPLLTAELATPRLSVVRSDANAEAGR